MSANDSSLNTLLPLIHSAQHIVVFTGAGLVSVAAEREFSLVGPAGELLPGFLTSGAG